MTTSNADPTLKKGRLSAVLLAASAAWLAAGHGAAAQQTTTNTAGVELPAVVVKGATLELKQPRPAKAAKAPDGDDDPEPAAKPKRKAKAPAGQSGGSAASSSQGADGQAQPASAGATDSGSAAGSGEGTPLDRIGSSVTVVSGEQLKDQQVRSAADALRSLPGVEVSRTNGVTGLTQVRLRGANGGHTLVLIDGVEANGPANGEFDFSDLSADNIERIEVIRGGQSALYGSNAVGGVINIITKGGRGPLTVTAIGEGGSFATRRGSVTISGGTDKAWGTFSAEKMSTNGFPISPYDGRNDEGDLRTFSFKGGVRLLPGVTLDTVIRTTEKHGVHDVEDAILGQLQQQVYDGSHFDRSAAMQAANLRWDALGGAFTQVLKVAHSGADAFDYSPSYLYATHYAEERLTYGYTATYRFTTPGVPWLLQSVTGLVERNSESFTPKSYSTDPFFPSAEDGIARERNRWSYAGEWRGEAFDRLFFTAGVRHDDNDAFTDFDTWRTSASLRLPELGLRPHASVGTAVKFPTMFEQFGAIPRFFTPNPGLKPEKSFGWDAGLEVTVKAVPGLVVDVTYFEADLKNEINGTATDPVTFNFTSVNLPGTGHRSGVEVAASYEILKGLRVGGSYTWLDAVRADGLTEVRRPKNAGRLDLTYAFLENRARLTVSAVYNGEMEDQVRRVTGFFFGFPILSPERTTLDNYWLVNVAASYKLTPNMEVFGRIENLLDARYQEVYGFATAGIAAYAGVKFTFEDPNTAAWAKYRE